RDELPRQPQAGADHDDRQHRGDAAGKAAPEELRHPAAGHDQLVDRAGRPEDEKDARHQHPERLATAPGVARETRPRVLQAVLKTHARSSVCPTTRTRSPTAKGGMVACVMLRTLPSSMRTVTR